MSPAVDNNTGGSTTRGDSARSGVTPIGVDDVGTAEHLIQAAVATVDDPEYPGVSIVDLGLLESCRLDQSGTATVELVPTFSGCPALAVIAEDVATAVSAVPGVTAVDVVWLRTPVWTTDRVSATGLAALADQFTVAVEIGRTAPTCPRCGGELTPDSMFGPSRCRSVARCRACTETVEVMRA